MKWLAGMLAPVLLAGFASFSASNNYQLNNYGINSGGTNSTSGSTYRANVGAGEVLGGASGATTYTAKSGSIEAQQSNVPGAPTLSNGGGTYYNKLNFTLNNGGNPTDTTFAVAVATDSGFSSQQFVQTDGTLGSNPTWQTYTQWGGSAGYSAVGLIGNTRYWFRTAAISGQFTASAFGPSANETTVGTSLTFSMSPSSLNMGTLAAGSVITSGSISFNFDTNASFGGSIYVLGSDTGLHSTTAATTLAVTPPSQNLDSLNSGFGLQGSSASAPLSIQAPYDGGGSNSVGAIYTSYQPLFAASSPVSSGTASAVLKAKAATTTPAANDYTITLTFVAAASY